MFELHSGAVAPELTPGVVFAVLINGGDSRRDAVAIPDLVQRVVGGGANGVETEHMREVRPGLLLEGFDPI
jgi:hypothetical protein